MKTAIFGNRYQQRALAHIERMMQELQAQGVDVAIESEFAHYLRQMAPQALPDGGLYDTFDYGDHVVGADVAISVGGDGTLLHTAQVAAPQHLPIVGVNSGHLGYLTAVDISQAPAMVRDLIAGRYEVETRTMLSLTCDAPLVGVKYPYALNEIVVTRADTSAMIEMDVMLDGVPLSTSRGDGLLVSTPTGSTAYNLSVGGPILQPMSRCLALSPISPHSLSLRPVVVADDVVITVVPRSRARHCQVSIDGEIAKVPSGTELRISKAPFATQIIMPTGRNFAETLRAKLLWGRDNR